MQVSEWQSGHAGRSRVCILMLEIMSTAATDSTGIDFGDIFIFFFVFYDERAFLGLNTKVWASQRRRNASGSC